MSKPVLLSGGNGKVKELVGTTNGQFLVNNGSNDVVFSTATAPTVGQVPVWSGSAWAPGANGSTGTVTSVSTVDTSMGLTLTTTNGTTTPQITLAGTLVVTKGGTNITSYAVGDLLYADTTTSLAKLADVATGNALVSGGVSTAPSWGKIDLTTHVSGTLPVANGGTGATTLTGYVKGSGTAALTASAAIPVADVTGAAPLASPTFTGTVTIPAGASISGFAPLASPTFTGTPAAPTASSGDNTTQIATTAFVKTAVANSAGAPYDLPFEIPGTPALSTKVVNFDCVRPFILSTTGHRGGQLTNPSGNFVCTVRKNSTTLGTITFASGGFSSSITATLTDRTFAVGDILSVETQATALGIDTPHATLVMSLV